MARIKSTPQPALGPPPRAPCPPRRTTRYDPVSGESFLVFGPDNLTAQARQNREEARQYREEARQNREEARQIQEEFRQRREEFCQAQEEFRRRAQEELRQRDLPTTVRIRTNRRSGLKSIGGEPLEPNGTPQGPYGVRGVAVRYFGPKQRHSLAVRSHGYTDWITVDAIADSRICVAQLMYLYIRASELLPAGVQGDALFLSHTARKDHETEAAYRIPR